MAEENSTQMANEEGQMETDPWAEAFAALSEKGSADASADLDDEEKQSDSASEGNDEDSDSASADSPDSGGLGASTGDEDSGAGESTSESEDFDSDLIGITESEVEEYRQGLTEGIRSRAVSDMAKEFAKRGIRNTKGKLGATINDADICKRDGDGVPQFYNPDTGREFTGDNPRRQAQEWVDDYNKELAKAFNQACETYVDKLLEIEQPKLDVIAFAPTYDTLDPIRQMMFDEIIADYEVTDDNGNVVGYSCNLNAALGAVDRQVSRMQAYGKANSASVKNEKSGPALDMKNSAGAVSSSSKPNPKSLAEALEWQQDQMLEKARKGNKNG